MTFVPIKKLEKNIDTYINIFKENFLNESEIYFASAPGRINIIGEHVDYCGYSVLPMSLEQNIFMIFSKGVSSKLQLINTNPKYEKYEGNLSNIKINDTRPQWYDYFLCGYQGMLDYMNENKIDIPMISLNVLVYGTIAPNAGLSSSSALVVCSSIVAMKCFGLDLKTRELAKICAISEHYIGTQGGGMDQCISLMGKEGKALLIDFSEIPISTKLVELPEDTCFVVTHSREQMNKAASNHFNSRVIETKLAAKVLLKIINPKIKDHSPFNRLVDVQKVLQKSIKEMIHIVKENLKEEYSREDLLKILDISNEEFQSKILSKNTQHIQIFKLRDRARHVLKEAERLEYLVYQSKSEDQTNNKSILGNLMNLSHNSLRDLYECSTPTLDRLVELCREAGALGSRLTGAGWGGCVISLIDRSQANKFMTKIAHDFYQCDNIEDLREVMFVALPSDGACFYEYNIDKSADSNFQHLI